ncbi:hypothetical protein BCR34DRAFT_484487 [Clohesyomyces aquaticus]|uniref:P-loop containing nucleoside triphosphate hydrolase protein n=1 Tax=Clohesyomyces aquaticus TaxID=1231657 RepID=A0A1Y1ZMM3_9PLEO|nr:hypothetical protein BCR34DRAFT_484487 [Clohesyomyces aquaticus]
MILFPRRETTESASSTPSISVTPTPSTISSVPSQSRGRTDSLVDGTSALLIGNSERPSPPTSVQRHLSAESSAEPAAREALNRSPSPARRRRSGSGINRTVHSVEDEEPPQSLFHLRGIQDALANARDLTTRMVNILAASALHQEPGSSIQGLYQRAVVLSEFQPPSSRTVGLVGDSGVGKSRLINSLLDKRDLARASSANGAACTCVVTEYHYHDRNDFVIDVDYFTIDDLEDQFRELLRGYREFRNNSQNMNQDEREAMKKRADLAENTFKASFGARFDNNNRLFLSSPLEEVVTTMVAWATEILPRPGALNQEGRTQESFATIDICSERLQALTSETESAVQVVSWPFIRKIRVLLRAHILSRGLIIADLPGLRDLNSARQNVTERYVRDCHQIFAVVDMGRAATNIGVQEVFALARRANLSNVGIVCTKSDDIQAREARTAWETERPTIDRLIAEINTATQSLEALETDIQEYSQGELSREEEQELIEMEREKRQLDLQENIMTVRNNKVRAALQSEYRDRSNIKTFCVSNTIYDEYRPKPVETALPFLRLSGIIELRQHCISIVAESHRRATTEYITNEIPALLGSMELWVQAGSGNASAERKQQILESVTAVESELDKLTYPTTRLSEISRSVVHTFSDVILQYMRQRARQWSLAAGNASMEWQSWHHSSFAAFCRQYGTHTTGAIGSRCWNSEAMESMTTDTTQQWDTFHIEVEAFLGRTSAFIEEVFNDIFRITNQAAASQQQTRTALRTLLATLRSRRGIVMYSIEDLTLTYHRRLSSLQTDAFSPIRTSIIGQLLEPTYRAANMECGTGSDRRRKAIITTGFRAQTLFDDHRRRFRERFVEISNELQEQMATLIAEQLAFIEADLNTLKDENVVLESERNPEFRTRLATEVERVEDELTRVRRAVEEVANAVREDVDMEG